MSTSPTLHALWILGITGLAAACGGESTVTQRCDCPVPAHGVQRCEDDLCEPCMCLPLEEATPDPEFVTEFFVDPDVAAGGDGSAASPWTAVDWSALDQALTTGDVVVHFSAREANTEFPETWPERLDILRTDTGSSRLVLEGSDQYNTSDSAPSWSSNLSSHRAIVPGANTGYEDVKRSRITLRGFEVTGSKDKGVYWRAGDDVILENLVIHDNKGSPSINLEYANRTGLNSSNFVVRNNHVFNQRGECIYIGGSEGEDQESHDGVIIANNMVNNCMNPLSSKHDGINIKDRIRNLQVHRNVVFNTNWGIEIASPGEITKNLVFETESNGFHMTDQWGLGLRGIVLEDNAVLHAGKHGVYLSAARQFADNVRLSHLTVVGSQKSGIVLGGEMGLSGALANLVLTENAVGLNGWGDVDVTLEACMVDDNTEDDEGELAGEASVCAQGAPAMGDLTRPAGEDGLFFTEDDPWLTTGVGARL